MAIRCERKILPLDELCRALQPRAGRTLVHCHGCFDVLHPGHIHYFEFAKQQGDLLLVSLNADAFFVDKGPGRPVFAERMRAIAIAALEVVDFVHINAGFLPTQLFEMLRPDVYVKGKEYDYRLGKEKIPEEALMAAHGGRVMYGPDDVIFSSSKVIAQMRQCQPVGAL